MRNVPASGDKLSTIFHRPRSDCSLAYACRSSSSFAVASCCSMGRMAWRRSVRRPGVTTSLGPLPTRTREAGWRRYVQVASAAKGGDACLKHVLNTRLRSARASLPGGWKMNATSGDIAELGFGAGARQRGTASPMIARSPTNRQRSSRGSNPARRPAGAARVHNRVERLYRSRIPPLVRFFTLQAGAQDAGDLVYDTFRRLAVIEP